MFDWEQFKLAMSAVIFITLVVVAFTPGEKLKKKDKPPKPLKK